MATPKNSQVIPHEILTEADTSLSHLCFRASGRAIAAMLLYVWWRMIDDSGHTEYSVEAWPYGADCARSTDAVNDAEVMEPLLWGLFEG